jgi:DNA-directed RNA polymerase subunit M/transcription elongation factor TFIIS
LTHYSQDQPEHFVTCPECSTHLQLYKQDKSYLGYCAHCQAQYLLTLKEKKNESDNKRNDPGLTELKSV